MHLHAQFCQNIELREISREGGGGLQQVKRKF